MVGELSTDMDKDQHSKFSSNFKRHMAFINQHLYLCNKMHTVNCTITTQMTIESQSTLKYDHKTTELCPKEKSYFKLHHTRPATLQDSLQKICLGISEGL